MGNETKESGEREVICRLVEDLVRDAVFWDKLGFVLQKLGYPVLAEASKRL